MKITTLLSVNNGNLGAIVCITKGPKLPLNKGFKNMFELQQSCAQSSVCVWGVVGDLDKYDKFGIPY